MRANIKRALTQGAEDDKALLLQGIDSLSPSELARACDLRGLRWIQVSLNDMRKQLEEYLSLSLDPTIPNLLLIFAKPKAPYSAYSLFSLSSLPKQQLEKFCQGLNPNVRAEFMSSLQIPISDTRRIAEKAGLTAVSTCFSPSRFLPPHCRSLSLSCLS